MTFGQHLEELRTCLFKAVIGIALGVAIGMCFGGSVVEFIKKPLADGLTKYVQNHLLAQTEARLQQLKEEGKAVPEDLAQIQSLVHQDNLLPQESFVDPAELVQQLRQMYPNLLSGAAVPARASDEPLRKDGMLRLFVWHPQQDDPRIRVKTLSAQEAFTVYLKASMLVGMLLASPWVFYQLWSFVGAGLYPHERRYVHVFLPFSLGLFLTGAATAFLFVFEPMLRFLF
jgi:sec-independent protein translocase protein TatC